MGDDTSDRSIFSLIRLEPRQLLTALPAGFVDTTVATGLTAPTAETVAPDGRLFIAEKGGSLRLVNNGVIQKKSFLSLAVDTYSERGLDGVALDPNFATNGYVYVYYTVADPVHPNIVGNNARNRLSRFKVSSTNPDRADGGSELVLLDNIPSTNGNHNGGSMVFGADGMLYLGIGEAGIRSNAQDLSVLNGKVLRLDVEHPGQLIPRDNPFFGSNTIRNEIWAYGFRNPFTSAIDPRNGTIFINDVGSNGTAAREEVNILQKGGNYGWSTVEGMVHRPGFVDPLYTYGHPNSDSGGAITGGAVYTATQFPPQWRGKYFTADFVLNTIRAIDPATGAETSFATEADSPVDLDQAPDGGIYYISATDGTLHEIHTTGVDVTGPDATLTSALRIRQGGFRYYTFTVTYQDDSAVNGATLDNTDIIVNGPKGFARNAVVMSASPSGNAGTIVATYGIKSPSGLWSRADDGVYSITLNRRQVRDTVGNPSPAGVLGAFSVKIP